MKNIILDGGILLAILFLKHCILDFSQRCFPCAHKEIFCSKGLVLHSLVVAGPQLAIIPIFAVVIGCVSWYLIAITVCSFVLEFVPHMIIDFVKTNYRLTHEQVLQAKRRRIMLDVTDQLFHFLSLLVCTVLDIFLLDLLD